MELLYVSYAFVCPRWGLHLVLPQCIVSLTDGLALSCHLASGQVKELDRVLYCSGFVSVVLHTELYSHHSVSCRSSRVIGFPAAPHLSRKF